MLLDHIGQSEVAESARGALVTAMQGEMRARDLGGNATTQEFADKIIEELK